MVKNTYSERETGTEEGIRLVLDNERIHRQALALHHGKGYLINHDGEVFDVERDAIGRFDTEGELKICYDHSVTLEAALRRIKLAKDAREVGVTPKIVSAPNMADKYASAGSDLLKLANELREIQGQ